MKSRTKLILFILTAVLVLLPLLQQHLHFLPFRKLSGVVEEQPRPEVTFSHFMDHSLQDWSESYLKLHYGLREPLTRWYNQYQWDFYGINNINKKWIYISDDGWFYESQNIREYYEGNASKYSTDSLDMAKQLEEESWRLFQLQHILESYDTHLFVLLIPGKEMLYPEHLPKDTPFQPNKQISAYDFFMERFDTLGINYIDVRQWFLEMKGDSSFLLFPQTGTHWSNLASMYVADSLIHYMENLGGMNIQDFSIGEKYAKTVEPDDDLEQLMNLIRPLERMPNYYAKTKVNEDPTAQQPVLITIGDSFYWNILNHTPFKKIFSKLPYWYYFSTVYFDEPARNIEQVDLVDELLDADFVMLSYSSPQLYRMGERFSKEALTRLCYDDNQLEAEKKALASRIKDNPNWYQGVLDRAENYRLSIDTALFKEADNLIQNNPSAFLPALKDSIPTQRSTKARQHSHGIQ